MALPTIGSSGGISASYLNQLIQLSVSQAAQPLTALNTEKDEVTLTKTAYQGLSTRFAALDGVMDELLAATGDDADDSVFSRKHISVSDDKIATATASDSAAPGTYHISVDTLAKNHRVRSQAQVHADQALSLTGKFVIGGALARAVGSETTVADTVTGFGTASITGGQAELATGAYHVEVRDDAGTFQFRIVDANGTAVSIASATDTDSFTTAWQDMADVAGKTFDSGRGLTVNFGSGPYTAGLKGSAANVQYTAQGAQVSVTETMSLNDIRNAINEATYADGMGVQATIVNKQLVLTRLQGGSANRVMAADVDGTVLSGTGSAGLGLLGDSGSGDVDAGDGFRFTLQKSASATFTVNGISITRNNNSGLTDVVQGVTLNLLKEGESVDVTVASDSDAIVAKFKSLASNFNNLTGFLKQQSAVTINSDKTYKRGALAGDSLFGSLRYQLVNDMSKRPAGLSADAPKALAQIGLTFDAELNLTVSDEDKLKGALASNFAGVKELVRAALKPVADRLAPYMGTTGVIANSITTFDKRIDQITDSANAMTERLTAYEASLTKQYGALLEQLAAMQAAANTAYSLMGLGSIDLLS